jgi:hypothetical protein
MEDLAIKYGTFTSPPHILPRLDRDHTGQTIVSRFHLHSMSYEPIIDPLQVLTGGTGSLGTFLIDQLSALPKHIIHKIICLVRAPNSLIARQRVEKELNDRDLRVQGHRYEVFSAELSDGQLGLDDGVYAKLVNEVDVIIHVSHGHIWMIESGGVGCLASPLCE